MNTWKIVAGLLVAMVVAVVAIGVVAAQTPTANPTATSNQNIWTRMSNWIGNCFRWRTGQVNTCVQAPQVTTPTQPAGPSTTATPQPSQGYYHGYGPCLRWR